jgi:CheY-like chemotaxis protein
MEPADDDVVLIVEDNQDDVRLLSRAFRKAQIATPVAFAEDGERAVAFLDQRIGTHSSSPVPALVLLDLKLPRKSGFEVLEWIRRHPALRRLPVVVLTSSKESADLERAYDLGANSYLVKPVRQTALIDMVAQINTYWLSLNERPPLLRRDG